MRNEASSHERPWSCEHSGFLSELQVTSTSPTDLGSRRKRRKRGRHCQAAPLPLPPPRVLPALGVPIGLAPWLSVLFLMYVLGFSSIFGCDNPAALQTQAKQNMRVSTTKFMLLYAWYY